MVRSLICLALFSSSVALCQQDTLPYTLFSNNIVLYTDLGFNSSPFSIKDDFIGGLDKLQFKHNLKATQGLGVMYQWFSLRLGFTLPGTLRNSDRWGKTRYSDLRLSFSVKRMYCDVGIRHYRGYVVKNAYPWNDTLSADQPHEFRPNTRSNSVSVNTWYFFNKNFRMPVVIGKVGHYKKAQYSGYLRGTINIFGVGNDTIPLVPELLIDTTQNKSSVHTITAVDIGLIPGFAYVNRIDNWQFSVLGGFGGVIQARFLESKKGTRGFLGLAPRFDVRFNAGYSQPKYFVMLITDFDFKSIRQNELVYFQSYYSLRIAAGIRCNRKPKKSAKAGVIAKPGGS